MKNHLMASSAHEVGEGHISAQSGRKTWKAISIGEQIAEDLAADILNDRVKVGDRLGEEAIAARFNVSRGPIRAALRILERRGLAKSYPRRGFFVSELAPENFRDAIEIRFWLLVLAARTCARSRREEALTILDAQIARLREDTKDLSVTPSEFAVQISDIYKTMVTHSANPRLQPILQETLDESAWTLAWRYWSIDYTTVERRTQTVRIFEKLGRAIHERDGTAAERFAREHLEESLAVFLRQVEKRVREKAR
jgi:DNA-binding GntR family transcriptional regulator